MGTLQQAPIEHVGPNDVQVVDDTILVRYHGTLLPSEAKALLDRVDQLGTRFPIVYLLGDLTDAAPPPADARKVLAAWHVSGFECITIYFGGNLLLRTASQLILSAMRIIGRTTLETHHFATEVEAFAFLNARRETRSR